VADDRLFSTARAPRGAVRMKKRKMKMKTKTKKKMTRKPWRQSDELEFLRLRSRLRAFELALELVFELAFELAS
jgi:hypothetical protein